MLLAFAALPAATAGASDHPGLSPETVKRIVLPDAEFEVEKTVHTPEIPPTVEVCLLEDETGSFEDDIGNLQAGTTAEDIFDNVIAASPNARFAVAGFRDYDEGDYGDSGDWVYRRLSGMSPVKAGWLGGIALLTAGGGGDIPEAQYDAIVAALQGGFGFGPCGFNPDPLVTKVLLVATDAPFHTPDGTHINDEASTIAALDAAGVTLVGLKAPGAGGELDALAVATGGSVQPLSSDGANIAAAILAGLGNLPVEVQMVSDCTAPISVAFDPPIQTVISGGDAYFAETISVADGAAPGVYYCKDWALLNGEPMIDPFTGGIIYEEKIISVLVPVLQPPFESNELGVDNSHTVTATLLGHAPHVDGWLIDFTVGGQNAGEAGVCSPIDCRTDSNGEVTFTYTVPVEPDSLGLDTISATAHVGGDMMAALVGGFETGDLSNWDTQIPAGAAAYAAMSHGAYGPQDGNYFGLLKTDGAGSETLISQSFYATAGETISGWAFFDTGDYLPFNDYAEVRILSDGALLGTVFYADVAMVGDFGQTPWTYWEYVAPSDGIYTVQAAIANSLDSIYDSYMGLDIAAAAAAEKLWEDTTPPECEAELIPIQVTETQGEFLVSYECTDDVWPEVAIEADINGVPVTDGMFVDLVIYYDGQVVYPFLEGWIIKALNFLLTVRGEDGSGNVGWAYAEPVFENTYPSVGPPNADVMPPNLPPPGEPPNTEWPPPPTVSLTPFLAAPEDCTVELTKMWGYWNQGTFRVDASCIVEVETMTLDINGHEIENGDMVELVKTWGTERVYNMFGMLRIEAPEFLLTLTTTNPDGTWTAVPDF
jgi:hypothetical protein